MALVKVPPHARAAAAARGHRFAAYPRCSTDLWGRTMNGVLLQRPVEYFRTFPDRAASLRVALGAFLILALAEVSAAGEMPHASDVPQLIMWLALNWVFGVVFFGVLWFFVGARLLGGKANLSTTIRAVGYAFLVPAIVALAFTLVTAPLGKMAVGPALGVLSVKVLLGVWSVCLAGVAVKFVHALTWRRAVVVVLWMPAVLISLWLVVAAIIVLAVPFSR